MSPNHLAPPAQPMPAAVHDDDSVNLLDLLDVVTDSKWLIGGVTALALALGATYALLATPIYESDTLIQIEDNRGNPMAAMLGDASTLFDVRSPTTAEIEILRSRLVVGQAVDNLHLDLTVRPKYLPLVGKWLSRRADGPSNPGFLGMAGFVSGTEALQVSQFTVPPALEGERYSVVLLEQDGYELRARDGTVLGQGKFGTALSFTDQGQSASLLVDSAIGKPGAEFHVMRASRLRTTESLQRILRITEQGRQSGVVRAALQNADADRAAQTLNEIGALYVRQNVERKAAEAQKSLAFLNTQLPQLRQELEASEARFNQFRNQNNTFDLGSEAKSLLDQSVTLHVKLLEAQQKRKELEARYTAEHPSVRALDAQIRALEAQISGQTSKAKSLPSIEQDLLRLTRDVKVNNELYTNLLNSYQQLRLVKEGKVGNVRIVDVAVAAIEPVKPQRALILALAGALGLMAGLALAFVRNSLRPGIKDPSDIEHQLGLNVFATVPHSKAQETLAAAIKLRKPGAQLLATSHPDDPCIESLRSLRTALQFAMLDASNNIVLISGPTPNIGKSFASANFAAVLGAGGKRVLLVDADMRKGHMHQYFGVERGLGLSDLITGSQPLSKVLRAGVAPQVDLITTGTLPPNPAEVLLSPATAQQLQALAAQYDIVIIDTPPVLAVSDVLVLAPHAGTVFLVARAEVTALGELQESAKRLGQAGTPVRGIIFNDLDMSRRRYGYGYGYKYGRYRYAQYQYAPSSSASSSSSAGR